MMIVNKWDLAMDLTTEECEKYIRGKMKFLSYAPVLQISAKLKQGTDKIIPLASRIHKERHKRISTGELNSFIQRVAASHAPPRSGTRQLSLYYATQAEINPPTFVFFVNNAGLVHFTYKRFLTRSL